MSNTHQKFLKCTHCGNLVGVLHNSGVPIICCGQPMEELIPNTVDASSEKHIPVITVADNIATVTVGSAPHPATDEHLIQWVYIATNKGGQRKSLSVGIEPSVQFALCEGEKIGSVYAYCNLHGLWTSKLL